MKLGQLIECNKRDILIHSKNYVENKAVRLVPDRKILFPTRQMHNIIFASL